MKTNTKLLFPWQYSLKKTLFLMTMFLGVTFGWQAKAQNYCIPTYSTGCSGGDKISNVMLEGNSITLANDSECSPDAYGDYTNLPAPDLSPGIAYTLSVTSDYSLPELEEVKAWIDYDNNGTFESSEEIASTQGNGLPESGTGEFTFTVPENVEPGEYRMRVRLDYTGNDIQPCEDGTYGETEDYTISVGTLEACEDANAGTPVMQDISVCAGETFTLEVEDASEPAGGLSRQWQSSPTGEEDWTDMEDAHANTYTVEEGVDQPTDFRYKVTCSNNDETDFSDIITVSLNPGTDAIVLLFIHQAVRLVKSPMSVWSENQKF